MKEEIKVFIRKPMVWFSLALLACAMVFSLIQLPDTSTYDALYEEYQESVDAYRNNYFLGKIPASDATEVLGEQWTYLTKTVTKVFPNNVEAARSRLGSSLFQDEVAETQDELAFEENRVNAGIAFVNIYRNQYVLENNVTVYALLIIGIISIISMFYDDIENGTIKLFHSLQCHLPTIFIHKWFVFVLWMFLLCGFGYAMDIVCTKGNYTIYNIPAYQNTFMNLTIHEYLMWKYLNCLINVLLVSFFFFCLLLFTRNHVTSFISGGIILFLSYLLYTGIADGSTLTVLKYANLYQWLFADIYEYSSIYSMTFLIKIGISVAMMLLAGWLYIKEIYVKPLFQKKRGLRSVNPCMHIMHEVYFESKGILTIVLVVLFGIYNIQQFQISKGSQEDAYQEFKSAYLGDITEETYQRICDDYDEISTAYEEAKVVYQQAAELALQMEAGEADEEDPVMKLYSDNASVLSKANKMDKISTLKSEYETAMELGTKKLIDDRGGNQLLMKDQDILRVESVIVVVLPLLATCIYHCFLMRNKERYLLINTSSLGLKVTKKLNHITYFFLILIDTVIAICMHVYKVSTQYKIDYTNTLSDLLVSSLNIPLWAVLLLAGCAVVIGTYVITILTEKVINRYLKAS